MPQCTGHREKKPDGERFCFDPEQRRTLEPVELIDRLRKRADVLVRLDEEAACPRGWI